MTELPDGWHVARLGDVADTALGKMLDKSKDTGQTRVPYLRNVNVQWGRIDLADVLTVEMSESEQQRFALSHGDLLVCEGGEVGRAAIWSGSGYMAYQKALHRIRPRSELDVRYLRHVLEHLHLKGHLASVATGSTIKHLPQERLRELPIPLPALEEQRRIVDILEDHLSRLDVAGHALLTARRRLKALRRSVLLELIPEGGQPGWRWTTVAEAGAVDLGRQRHPDWHTGPTMRPYLRVANVFEDRIDVSDVMEMDFTGVFERYKLSPGDVLLNEGQSPELLGRPAIYRGIPADVAFTNSLIRFRANADVIPEWALLVFRRHMHAGRFSRESRITTNIAHLSASRFKTVEFPIPSLEDQRRLVAVAEARSTQIDHLDGELERLHRERGALRRALLSAAFTGRLTTRGSTPPEFADA